MDARNETPQIHRILDRTESALRAIRDEAAPGKIVVLLIPTWISVFPGAFEKRMREMKDLARNSNVPFDPQDYEVGTCARRLAELFPAPLGVGVVDLTPQLMGRVDLYLPHDRHLAPAGHAFVARLLEPVVAPLLTGER
jgi:DNA-binding transcriptional LysR family regulator